MLGFLVYSEGMISVTITIDEVHSQLWDNSNSVNFVEYAHSLLATLFVDEEEPNIKFLIIGSGPHGVFRMIEFALARGVRK